MSRRLRVLGVLSSLELVSVMALLANLATVHDDRLAAVLGPVHGGLYLAVAALAVLGRDLSVRTRLGAVVPVLSGPLTVLNVRHEGRRRRP